MIDLSHSMLTHEQQRNLPGFVARACRFFPYFLKIYFH